MKPEQNYWVIICLVTTILTLSLLGLGAAQDQNPPGGYDKGVWVLSDKKPDVEAEKDWDNGAYYNNHVSFSGSTVEGSYDWKDGDDPDDCKGKVKGKVSWTELPGVLEPGVKQETTITAEASGEQSCSARHPGACAHLEINEVSLEPHPCVDFSSGDKKQDVETAKVSWEAPWGKIGDTLTITLNNKVSGSLPAYINYIYSYQAKAPATQPSSLLPKSERGTKKPEPEPCCKESCDYRSWWSPRAESRSNQDSGVRFSGLSGQVDIRPDNDPNAWRGAGLKSKIYIDDHVRTEEDSSAILSFPDMTTFNLKPESEVIIDTPPEKDSKLSLVCGKIWTNVKKMMKDGTMEVQMSQAVAGIKGTIIVSEETGTSSILKVLEGKAYFRSRFTGEERLVNAGESVTATASGLSPTQSFDIEAERASWQEYLPKTQVTEPKESKVIYDNWNKGGVNNNPSCNPRFTISEPHMIAYIDSYHWNDGRGTTKAGSISLRSDAGMPYGPWDAIGEPGMGGVPNAWWKCSPIEVIPAGTYTIVDSDPATWSQNSESDGCGFSKVSGYAATAATGTTAPRDTVRTDIDSSTQSQTAGSVDSSEHKVDEYPVSSDASMGAEITQSDISKAIFVDQICSWTGTWDTNFGSMDVQMSGNSVTGTYPHDQGRIQGAFSENKLIGKWFEAPSYNPPNDAGDLEFTMSADCRSFSGNWRYGSTGSWSGGWSGTRQ
ncbi:MAG: FecR family protein [Methanotrichaceae archaeon]|nr:FecR family protein [Methanotrichaceae archaeon]